VANASDPRSGLWALSNTRRPIVALFMLWTDEAPTFATTANVTGGSSDSVPTRTPVVVL
jgi:hypothetical protein